MIGSRECTLLCGSTSPPAIAQSIFTATPQRTGCAVWVLLATENLKEEGF